MAALGIAGLGELMGEETVEAHSVVVVAVDKLLEVGNRAGSGIVAQLDHDPLRFSFLPHLDQHNRDLGPRAGRALGRGASSQQEKRQEGKED